VTGVDGAFNQKVLITKTIQNVQTQMRKDRHDQAAIIFNNMKCKVDVYPLGMALSDLELYHRAGTFSSGLIGIANTVNTAEATSKAIKDSLQAGGGAAPLADQLRTLANQVATLDNDCVQRPSARRAIFGRPVPRQ
jgi:hypothetical protein